MIPYEIEELKVDAYKVIKDEDVEIYLQVDDNEWEVSIDGLLDNAAAKSIKTSLRNRQMLAISMRLANENQWQGKVIISSVNLNQSGTIGKSLIRTTFIGVGQLNKI